MVNSVFSVEALNALRVIPLTHAIESLGFFWRNDDSFKPLKNAQTFRVSVSSLHGDVWELVITGSRWFDTRHKKGGEGSIDLAIYLTGQPFKKVLKALTCL